MRVTKVSCDRGKCKYCGCIKRTKWKFKGFCKKDSISLNEYGVCLDYEARKKKKGIFPKRYPLSAIGE